MEKTNQLRIAILGPESTGKSILSKELTNHFKVAYIPEYARFFLKTKQSYTFGDVTHIAKQQFQSINHYESSILIADTELIVTKIWQEYKYQKVDPWIEKHIKKQHFDLYLLMDIDLEWTFDPLRENPSLSDRKDLLNMYEGELQNQGFNYQLISGQGTERLNNALAAIKNYTKS